MDTHWGADPKGGISWRFHPAHPHQVQFLLPVSPIALARQSFHTTEAIRSNFHFPNTA